MVLLSQLRSARRYKWLSVTIVWLLCLGGWALVSQMPDQYRAEAKVKVDVATVVAPILAERRIDVDAETRAALLIELLLSNDAIHRIAESSAAGKAGEFDETVFQSLKDAISMEGGADDTFVVSVVWPDAKASVQWLNSTLSGMDEIAKSMLDYSASGELRVLEQKIADLETRVSELSQPRGSSQSSQASQEPQDPRLQVVKSELEASLKRREELKAALEQAIRAHPKLFEVLEPPVEPTSPFSPDRIMLHTVVLISALALTMLLAIAVNLLRPTLTSAEELHKVTGLPVLGSVSVSDCPVYQRSHGLSRFAFVVALASLGAVFIMVVVLESSGINLHHLSA